MPLKPCQAARLKTALKALMTKNRTLQASHKEKKMYLLTFLIDVDVNQQQWAVTWESIKKHVKSFHGKPGLAYTACDWGGCKLNHTEKSNDLHWSLKNQEPFRVTTIIDTLLDENTKTAYAVHRVDDAKFAEKVRRGEIKYLSPSIFRTDPDNDTMRTDFTNGKFGVWIETENWTGVHDAFVDKPAYGPKAVIVQSCEGTELGCLMDLGKMVPQHVRDQARPYAKAWN